MQYVTQFLRVSNKVMTLLNLVNYYTPRIHVIKYESGLHLSSRESPFYKTLVCFILKPYDNIRKSHVVSWAKVSIIILSHTYPVYLTHNIIQ